MLYPVLDFLSQPLQHNRIINKLFWQAVNLVLDFYAPKGLVATLWTYLTDLTLHSFVWECKSANIRGGK